MASNSSSPLSTTSAAHPVARPGPDASPARHPALPRRAGTHRWSPVLFALALVVPVYNVIARVTQPHPHDPQDARRVEAQTLLVLNAVLFTLTTSILSVFYAAIVARVVLHVVALLAVVVCVAGVGMSALEWTDACDGRTREMGGACVAATAWALLLTFLFLDLAIAVAARAFGFSEPLLILTIIGALVAWASTASTTPSSAPAPTPVLPITMHLTGDNITSIADIPARPTTEAETENLREANAPLLPVPLRVTASPSGLVCACPAGLTAMPTDGGADLGDDDDGDSSVSTMTTNTTSSGGRARWTAVREHVRGWGQGRGRAASEARRA